ncbi:MAG: sialidase family protein [Phycisphaerales bacterium]
MMMHTRTREWLVGAAVVGALGAPALAQNAPRVDPQVRVNQDASGFPQNETTAASSDFAPSRVVMGWNDYRQGSAKTGVALSTDGGRTWSDMLLRPAPQFQAGTEGDPMVAADHRDGTMWAGGIAFSSNGGLFVSRLDPGSTTFGPVVMAARNSVSPSGAIDKGWLAAGPDALDPTNPNKTLLYCAYNDGLIRSTDKGATWTNPQSLGFGLGFLPRVGPNGELYILFWDTDDGIKLWRSFNNAATLQGPFHVATRMDVWGIDGSRFPGDFRVPPLAYLAVDPNDGTLYCVYFDTTNIVAGSSNVDLYFTKSVNQGTSWTTPVIVNQNDSTPPGDSFFPWIEVDRSGRIHMVFHDTRNGAPQSDFSAHALIDAYYSYSDDAGATWHESRLTPASFNSANDGFGDSFMGDYHGLAVGGWVAYPLYVSTQNAEADVFTNVIVRCAADQADPPGQLDFSDVVAFLGAFGALDPAADLAPPMGQWDFSDVVAYLTLFANGCP